MGLILIVLLAAGGCSRYGAGGSMTNGDRQDLELRGRFAIDEQVAPPVGIQSLRLHPEGRPGAPPVMELGRGTLQLSFDVLQGDARQYRIALSHRSKSWQASPIGPAVYMEGFYETTFGGGSPSLARNPSYRRYTYTIPNQRLRITKSGNYLLSVYNYQSDALLFRLPFFVTENRGRLQTRIETLYNQRADGRPAAQPFSRYAYPDFVQQPQFDLSFAWAPNQFWGRTRTTDFFDTATPGVMNAHLPRDKAFLANYAMLLLDLTSLSADGRQIVEVQPGPTPPVVVLRRDAPQLGQRTARFPAPVWGTAGRDTEAAYADVRFSLETDERDAPGEVYLVGDFNQWQIDPRYRMAFDSTAGLWRGQAVIRQGRYAYKYVRLRDGQLSDLAFDPAFTERLQQYTTFVYFKDPERRFDRLLQVHHSSVRE